MEMKRLHHALHHRCKIDGGGSAIPDQGGDLLQSVEDLFAISHPSAGEAQGIGSGDTDRGSATDCELNDGLDDFFRRREIKGHFLMGKASLVEELQNTIDVSDPAQREYIAGGPRVGRRWVTGFTQWASSRQNQGHDEQNDRTGKEE